ncbi:MAG: hypothetical protein K9G33_00610 [Sneathiella sp.]|nr:hypothetical protein [Sneathiella sp.]
MTEMKITLLENRAVLALTGKDTHGFLQNLITNDMDQVSETRAIYAALLTAQGKFLHDFFVLKQGEGYLLDCAADRKDDLVRRLTMYKLRANVTIAESGYSVYALFGEEALVAIGLPEETGAVKKDCDILYFADPRLLAMGIRIIAPIGFDPTTAVPGATMVLHEDYEALRLAYGIPEGGSDIIPEKNFLLEANFEELGGVSFNKGCYVGQELTARTKHRAKIKKRLFQITYDGTLSPGDVITQNGSEIAEVRSFANGQGLALVRIDNLTEEAMEPEGVKLKRPEYLEFASPP